MLSVHLTAVQDRAPTQAQAMRSAPPASNPSFGGGAGGGDLIGGVGGGSGDRGGPDLGFDPTMELEDPDEALAKVCPTLKTTMSASPALPPPPRAQKKKT